MKRCWVVTAGGNYLRQHDDGTHSWTRDPDHAIHLATQEEAERIARWRVEGARVEQYTPTVWA